MTWAKSQAIAERKEIFIKFWLFLELRFAIEHLQGISRQHISLSRAFCGSAGRLGMCAALPALSRYQREESNVFALPLPALTLLWLSGADPGLRRGDGIRNLDDTKLIRCLQE